ncbi:MAG: TOTE conflict system archaeo-eukaryotic primase domain-containing protein [Desulfitobacteriaceae bacterium]
MMDDNLMKRQLKNALDEVARLKAENEYLRSFLVSQFGWTHPIVPALQGPEIIAEGDRNQLSPSEKVSLFRSVFRGREDVFAVRWKGREGKSGYAPACKNEWQRPLCQKPKVKCAGCHNRELLPLTDQVIYEHLTGKRTIGIYPLLPDDTCWFLAADFDKTTWQEDAGAFVDTCSEMKVPAVLERSRSGNGGHVWIFFDAPISAAIARKLGFVILTRTMDHRHYFGLDSYDRFFPNQDTMPKGGFGNLIALPLQRPSRDQGNSLFIDSYFKPYVDQWAFLGSLERMSREEAERIIEPFDRDSDVLGVKESTYEEDGDPWVLPNRQSNISPLESLPKVVKIVLGNLVYIEKDGLSSSAINRLMRLAAFRNPEFYKAQKMRLPTFGKPIMVNCAQDFSRYIGLPRGCQEEVIQFFKTHQVRVDLEDKRFTGIGIDINFEGELKSQQQDAVSTLLEYDNGVLSATTAFGKTVVALNIMASRKVNTLILVHRRQLMDQWKERLATFLGKPVNLIGEIGGGKDTRTGKIDIAIIQSLVRNGEVKDSVTEYGQVIVDECHHISAFSFELVLKKVAAKYVLGLTATPVRKDGHHPIVMMQCGPIRYRVSPKQNLESTALEHIVIPRYTNFTLSESIDAPGIQEIYAALVRDESRNAMIFDDVLKALDAGRSPLILTERTSHIEELTKLFGKFARNIKVLRGGMGKKQREQLMNDLASIPDEEERLLIATGRYVGEGFDDARLDTLFLVMPISWRGTLQQYAGRLHRLHHNKQVVTIYDYVDAQVPMMMVMYKKRLKGYATMGYKIQDAKDSTMGHKIQTVLF